MNDSSIEHNVNKSHLPQAYEIPYMIDMSCVPLEDRGSGRRTHERNSESKLDNGRNIEVRHVVLESQLPVLYAYASVDVMQDFNETGIMVVV